LRQITRATGLTKGISTKQKRNKKTIKKAKRNREERNKKQMKTIKRRKKISGVLQSGHPNLV
jgi:hypothetical protein